MKKILICLLIAICILQFNLKSNAQCNSQDTYYATDHDTLRVLLIFAELENDPLAPASLQLVG